MNAAIGFPLILVFAWCAAGVVSGFVVAERQMRGLLAWPGLLAAGSLWAAGGTLIGTRGIEDTRRNVAVHFRTAIQRQRQNICPAHSLFFYPLGDSARRRLDGQAIRRHAPRLAECLCSVFVGIFVDRSDIVPNVLRVR